MASHGHPRRRSVKTSPSPMTPSAGSTSLSKSNTFHAPTTLASDIFDPVSALMPRRSPTCPKKLEDLLVDASQTRVARVLESFDKTVSGQAKYDASILKQADVLPVPSFMLDNTNLDAMDIDTKSPPLEHDHHASDSGLGSSISATRLSCVTSHSAVTRSMPALGSTDCEEEYFLSDEAVERIHHHIIKPILKEESLEDFHPLIKDIPLRIGARNITNLRDLEKTLVFLAPGLSKSPSSFLRFCNTSIHCIAATVNNLTERDQRRPTDRPYTNHYFVDLVEQIRRYAAIMAATREKEAAGEQLDDMDYDRDEKVTLRGGLSHDGQPMELVREKKGKVIPIATDRAREGAVSAASSSKRALTDDPEDDGIRRSMARRRKSDRPGHVTHVCRDCSKEFKRPCDLTKHEKTHSRPWKCPDAKCKYHEQGWPTEKERDRHVNDKHSTTPAMYKCHYPPCTYSSKRESNCKQHMEKAHGWEYVRLKSNGQKKAPASSENQTPATPLTPFIPTPASALPMISAPATPFGVSPLQNTYNDFGTGVIGHGYEPRRGSVSTAGSGMTYSSGCSPAELMQPTSFDEAVTPEDTGFNHGVDNFEHFTFQQPTPALSTHQDPLLEFYGPLSFDANLGSTNAMPHLSPGAQLDVTLFTPQVNGAMQIDEGFGDGVFKPDGDFTLFDSGSNMNAASASTADWFEDMPNFNNFGGQFNAYCPSISGELDEFMPSFTAPQ